MTTPPDAPHHHLKSLKLHRHWFRLLLDDGRDPVIWLNIMENNVFWGVIHEDVKAAKTCTHKVRKAMQMAGVNQEIKAILVLAHSAIEQ